MTPCATSLRIFAGDVRNRLASVVRDSSVRPDGASPSGDALRLRETEEDMAAPRPREGVFSEPSGVCRQPSYLMGRSGVLMVCSSSARSPATVAEKR
jgi:hypothetical protein